MIGAEGEALLLSVGIALGATALAAPFALVVGLWLQRLRGTTRALVEAIAMAPLVLPPVVTGYALLWLLGPAGPAGSLLALLGMRIPFTTTAAVIAGATVGFPLFLRGVRMGLEGVDTGLIEAARTLGASPWRALRTIVLPLALPGITSGAVLAFARALGEFGATMVFAGNIEGTTRTLPLAIWSSLQTPGGESTAARLALITLVASLTALVASELLVRRSRR